MEKYAMVGYGDGWDPCDLLSVSPFNPEPMGGMPTAQMDIDGLKALDISSLFSFSHCLLVTAMVNDNTSMKTIVEFGWTAVQHKRVGMILQLGPNMSLEMAKNTTKLPFAVGAQLADSNEEFLCKAVGMKEPILQQSMCDLSQRTSLLGKRVRVGLSGFLPYFYMREDGAPDGVDMRFFRLLYTMMKFYPDPIPCYSLDHCYDLVGNI